MRTLIVQFFIYLLYKKTQVSVNLVNHQAAESQNYYKDDKLSKIT